MPQTTRYFNQILSKSKNKKEALKTYLKKIVIFQSYKFKKEYTYRRRATLNMTLRQIREKTGLSISYINDCLKEFEKEGLIKIAGQKSMKHKSKAFKDCRFFYFPDIQEAIIKKEAFKRVGRILKALKSKKDENRTLKNNFYQNYRSKKKKLMQQQAIAGSNPHFFSMKAFLKTFYLENFKFLVSRIITELNNKAQWNDKKGRYETLQIEHVPATQETVKVAISEMLKSLETGFKIQHEQNASEKSENQFKPKSVKNIFFQLDFN